MYIGTHASSPAIAEQAIRPLKNKLFSDENNKGKNLYSLQNYTFEMRLLN